MKLFTYILTLYLVFLAVVPCCAFDECPDDNLVNTESRNEKNKDCGACSPFFNCEKCASATINMEQVSVASVEVPVSPVYSDFICPRINAVHYDFWQPPRLG